jgi:hypothetical protein
MCMVCDLSTEMEYSHLYLTCSFSLAASGRRLLYSRIAHARSAGMLSRCNALGHWKET